VCLPDNVHEFDISGQRHSEPAINVTL